MKVRLYRPKYSNELKRFFSVIDRLWLIIKSFSRSATGFMVIYRNERTRSLLWRKQGSPTVRKQAEEPSKVPHRPALFVSSRKIILCSGETLSSAANGMIRSYINTVQQYTVLTLTLLAS